MQVMKNKRSMPNYGNTGRGYAKKGALALVITIFAAVIQLVLILAAARIDGRAPAVIGLAAIFDMALSVWGIWIGLQSFHEVDKRYLVSQIAIGLGGLTILAYLFMYFIGLR